jgi:zinc transport system substrate-binding protein
MKLLFPITIALLAALSGCDDSHAPASGTPSRVESGGAAAPSVAASSKALVMTTFYPTFYFAKRIVGDIAKVECPVPEDADPIFWQPTGEQIARFQSADLIVTNGAEYEKWVATASLPMTKTCDTSHVFESELIKFEGTTHTHGSSGPHSHVGVDGHTWMDPNNAKRQAEQILLSLSRKWPEYEKAFRNGFASLSADLDTLNARLLGMSDAARKAHLIASHPAYGYIAKRYGWKIATIDLPPDSDPAPEAIAALHSAVANLGPGPVVLFFESSPKDSVLNALKAEPRITYVVFEPAETLAAAEQKSGTDYLTVMNRNLDSLGVALGVSRSSRQPESVSPK